MKLAAQRVDSFLRDPGPCRAVLLYGDDEGLIRERASALVRHVAGALDDPFRVADLGPGEEARLAEEADAGCLMGGRRVVRLRGSDAATKAMQAFLSSRAAAFLVIEAPDLPARSRLRALMEAAADAVAIGCYGQDAGGVAASVRGALAAAGVGVAPDVVAFLAGRLGMDRGCTRSELDKLVLWAGPGGTVDMDAASACTGDLAGLSLEDALFAATAGDVARSDRALELALTEGVAPVAALRSALLHIQRLHRARLAMPPGGAAADTAKAARPPVFFRRIPDFAQALALWSAADLVAAGTALADAERACKRTAAPAEAIGRNAILTMARRAAAASARFSRDRAG